MPAQKPGGPYQDFKGYGRWRMDEKCWNSWQDHSLHFLEMALRTDKRGVLANPDGYGKKIGHCGDTIEFFLTLGVDGERIQSAMMKTDACIDTVACANAVAFMVEGKTPDEALEITPETVMDYLETLSTEKEHCAEFALGAFQRALINLLEVKRNPWKKFYQCQ